MIGNSEKPGFVSPQVGLFYKLLVGSDYHHLHAAIQNYTVDDTNGDPSGFSILEYIPQKLSSWNNGPDCSGCTVHPNINNCLDQTYHGATVGINGTARGYNLTFYGMHWLSPN